jgi:3-deoxy-D-manno-octulosonate 8-phosphate phosphatase (KDO 8-P phosphatase)
LKPFLNKLSEVSAFVFDVDGVMTDSSILVTETGEQLRTFNIKDGYALQLAVKSGYPICIISGGRSQGVVRRLNTLGIKDVHIGVLDKFKVLDNFIQLNKLDPAHILYMGDDIPDLQVMQHVGLPVCPADAAEEIKGISLYISTFKGGKGCVRDVIEKVLKIQGKWMSKNVASQ